MKKRRKIDLWREWGVPDFAYHRYEGLRGIYWYFLSLDVRYKEWKKWDKKCLTCLEEIEDWLQADCGHVVASHGCGEYLRFHRDNLTIQHKGCNNPRISPNAAALNAIHYDVRHGFGAYQKLYDLRKKEAKQPTQEQYRELIRSLSSYRAAQKL